MLALFADECCADRAAAVRSVPQPILQQLACRITSTAGTSREHKRLCRRDIEAALPVMLRHKKPLMLHAEILSPVDATCAANCTITSHATWAATRPVQFEIDAAKEIVAAMRNVRAAHRELWVNATQGGGAFGVHIAHLAAADTLPIYAQVWRSILVVICADMQ